jgi:hypothetical protein
LHRENVHKCALISILSPEFLMAQEPR